MNDKKKRQRFPKPKVIGEIPMIKIGNEVYGFEVAELSKEEQEYLKKRGGKKVNEVEKLVELIKEAWFSGDINPDDKFGDFLKRASQAILAAGYLPVQEYKLGGLTPKEKEKIVSDWLCQLNPLKIDRTLLVEAGVQAVLNKNKGKLYRVKETT